MLIAHKKTGPRGGEIHEPIQNHSLWVAQLARRFARRFHASTYAYDTGMNHDAGKYQAAFQKYIRKGGVRGSVKHSRTGAYALLKEGNPEDILMALCIYGHHGGLKSVRTWKSDATWKTPASYEYRSASRAGFTVFHSSAFSFVKWASDVADHLKGFSLGLLTRMIYSSLVDADWLATELWMDRSRYSSRYTYDTLNKLLQRHKRYMASIRRGAPRTLVNRVRSVIHRSCCLVARSRRGIFSLEVPTGGGKTLASMSFALRHAVHNRQKRVIVVEPYTSIITQNVGVLRRDLDGDGAALEQTADEYRKVYGARNVIEHHSTREMSYSDRDGNACTDDHQERLIENWDAPIVVTTFVQFFESLFASYRSRCRKLHNIANSVLIFDEVQALPEGRLKPLLETMRLLVDKFNCTIVLSTATQPAFGKRPDFDIGLQGIRPIIKIPKHIFDALRRVDVKYMKGRQTWKSVAKMMRSQRQVVAIVNTKKNALDLISQMPDDTLLLSGYMTPRHRLDTIDRIKAMLRNGDVCRVVSTQVIEAGVDVDFPVGLREAGPYDSIVQSAGRVNREGLLPGKGTLHVFRVTGATMVPGVYQKATDTFEMMLRRHGGYLDIYDIDTYGEYYSDLYSKCDWDKDGIFDLQGRLDFEEVNNRFRLIDTGMDNLIIPTDQKSMEAVRALKDEEYDIAHVRVLQRYSINIWERDKSVWLRNGLMYPLFDVDEDEEEESKTVFVLRPEALATVYDDRLGLIPGLADRTYAGA